MFKKTQKNIAMLIGIIAMLTTSACSASKELAADNIKVQRISSNTALVTHAYVNTHNSAMILRGELKRNFYQRGTIPGRLKIELINQEGIVFKETHVDYMQKNAKSRYAKFSYAINEDRSTISMVRVTHDDGQ